MIAQMMTQEPQRHHLARWSHDEDEVKETEGRTAERTSDTSSYATFSDVLDKLLVVRARDPSSETP